MFAWQSYARGLCAECHTHTSDWLNDAGEPLDKPRKRFETRRWPCPGCGRFHIYRERVKGEIADDEGQWVGLEFVTVANNGAVN